MIVECPGCHSRYDVTGRPAGTQARCRCGTAFGLPAPAESAGSLQCPQCGATTTPDRARCDHCRTVLSVVACPRCFGRLFVGARHCQHCGAGVEAPARAMESGSAAARKCPRCATAEAVLTAHLVAETLLDECQQCAGVWLDTAAFERVVSESGRQTALKRLFAAPALTAGDRPGWRHPVAYLHCPDCRTMMTRQNFGRCSGVIVDVCRPHGIWFDRDELGAVLDFVARGGLDKARRLESEELARQLEQRQSILASLNAASAVGSTGEGSRSGQRIWYFGEMLEGILDSVWD